MTTSMTKGTRIKTGLGVACAAAALTVSPVVIGSTAPAGAATHDGQWPISSGCSRGARTVETAVARSGGTSRAIVQLRYSPRCKTAWAKVTTVNIRACDTNSDRCAAAKVVRRSDGRAYACGTKNGRHSCYTRMVNDNGVRSYARGHVDYGARTYSVRTGSY